MTASGKVKEKEDVQCAILLHLIGEDALEIYNTFTFTEGESRDKIEILKKKFEDYANPRKNTVFERYKFWECKQQEGETIDQFITELKTRAKLCEFGEQTERACGKTRNNGTKPPERNHRNQRNHRNGTTGTSETTGTEPPEPAKPPERNHRNQRNHRNRGRNHRNSHRNEPNYKISLFPVYQFCRPKADSVRPIKAFER